MTNPERSCSSGNSEEELFDFAYAAENKGHMRLWKQLLIVGTASLIGSVVFGGFADRILTTQTLEIGTKMLTANISTLTGALAGGLLMYRVTN
jgi:hypothetical protein